MLCVWVMGVTLVHPPYSSFFFCTSVICDANNKSWALVAWHRGKDAWYLLWVLVCPSEADVYKKRNIGNHCIFSLYNTVPQVALFTSRLPHLARWGPYILHRGRLRSARMIEHYWPLKCAPRLRHIVKKHVCIIYLAVTGARWGVEYICNVTLRFFFDIAILQLLVIFPLIYVASSTLLNLNLMGVCR